MTGSASIEPTPCAVGRDLRDDFLVEPCPEPANNVQLLMGDSDRVIRLCEIHMLTLIQTGELRS